MTVQSEVKFQLGKNLVTPGAIKAIDNSLKTHKRVRISVLKAATRDRTELKKIAEEIKSKTEKKTEYRILGYTIILIKQ
ncbi:hypothetical protein CMI45_03285 [Candidatus Pacearchaeota archaeon]|nr:hypothetical protein [Candidatus Pacearchaeota archaeon]|tara:strand:+ start:877 stop:1113 length:237 start_codon:yes stop_codon:yes gene_type:complete